MLKVAVLLGQFDFALILTVSHHSELKQVDTLAALDHLVVEFGADIGALNIVRVLPSATGLLVAEQEHVQVVVSLGSPVL